MTVEGNVHSPELSYQGIVIVSPNQFGEEPKDQDRARFFGPGLIGCVCDGVTSSPRSEIAAELVTSYAPILFDGSVGESLRTICDLLMAHREEFQTTQPGLPADMPEAMQAMLRGILRAKQAISHQTTISAIRLRRGGSDVGIDMVRCGDSAVLAFSSDGELLYSSLAHPSQGRDERRHALTSNGWRFGPGDQILARVEGPLADHTTLAANCGIQKKHLQNWQVYTPVDGRYDPKWNEAARSSTLIVARRDKLLVPRYLYGRQLERRGVQYRCLDYSSTIRVVPTSPPDVPIDGIEHRSSATAVLPDHFYRGYYDYVEDRFPCGTHFVLCSDGFYSAFATASQMWAWLQENRSALADPHERAPKLRDLHQKLHGKSGDDDLSLVWMHPTPATAPAGADTAQEQEE